jgi:hypothetical protein
LSASLACHRQDWLANGKAAMMVMLGGDRALGAVLVVRMWNLVSCGSAASNHAA